MATKTFEELKQMAIQIRDEKTNKQNTATRIGTQMVEHLNKLEQEYYNKENIDEKNKQADVKFSELEASSSVSLRRYISKGMKIDILDTNNVDGYLNKNGDIIQFQNSKTSDFVACKGNAKYAIYSHLSDEAAYCFYDENRQLINGVAPNDGFVKRTITTPANCRFIRYSTLTLSNDVGIEYAGDEKYIDEYYQRYTTTEAIMRKVYDEEVSNKQLTIQRNGHYIMPNGSIVPLSSYNISNPIQLKMGQSVVFDGVANSNIAMISKTDVSGTSYTPVVIGTGGSQEAIFQTVTYIAKEDCYLAFCAQELSTVKTISTKGMLFDIADVQEKIYDEKITEAQLTIQRDGYYIASDGSKVPLGMFKISNPIQLKMGEKVTFQGLANENVAMIAKTDAGGASYTPVVIGSGSPSGSILQTVTYTAKEDCYLAFCAQELSTVKIISIKGMLFDLQNEVKNIKEDVENVNILTAFDNIVCAGDSLTFSQVYTSSSGSRQAKVPYPNILARQCSVTSHILARAGASAKDCWNEFGSNIKSLDNALGIIYLGTNLGLTDTLNTDVVGDSPESWADNNTGCYCRIIQKMQSYGYRVLLLRIWTTSGSGNADLINTNNAIAHIAERFKCAVMDVPVTNAKQYHYYPDLSGYNAVHYNDLGYAWFASKLIDKVGSLPEEQMKLIIPK